MVSRNETFLKGPKSPSLGSISRAPLGSDRKSDRHLSLFFGGFYTTDHNRTALLPGATERFKRTCLMVLRDGAIYIGFESPSFGSISRAALGSDRKSDRHLPLFLMVFMQLTTSEPPSCPAPGSVSNEPALWFRVTRLLEKGPNRLPSEVYPVRR